MLTRRAMFKGALLGTSVVLTGRPTSADDDDDVEATPSPRVEIQKPLPIPPLHVRLNRKDGETPPPTPEDTALAWQIYEQAIATNRFKHGNVSPDGEADYYEVVAQEGTASIFPNLPKPTDIWGYNGYYPGPTFIARRNRTMVVRLLNRVDEIVSMHYHGGHTPPDSDGTPMESYDSRGVPAVPGGPAGSRVYVFPNDNEFPATFWYHDHGLDVTGHNVYQGLAGFVLLKGNEDHPEDADFLAVDAKLPSGYGKYDIPMVFQDRRFDADGQLVYNTFDHDGFLGDRFLVNGAIQPYLDVAPRRYRFRFLNGSNARFYELFLSNGDTFTQIGTDGALMAKAIQRRSILIAPAERYEVVIDFSGLKGSTVYLLNCLQQDDGRGPDDEADRDRCTPLVQFRVGLPTGVPALGTEDNGDAADLSANRLEMLAMDLNPRLTTYINKYLNPAKPLTPGVPIPTRRLKFERGNGAWQINGRFFDRNRVDLYERLNTQSIWRLENSSGGWVHPVHIHDMQFLLLDRNGRPPRPGERGLKDVFYVGENETLRVMAYWSGDQNVGRYVFHCHNIEHEDMAMMGIFQVLPAL
jgi:FtsP/CotA-like multicopper oxidase with cupredoxin domain